MLPAHAGVIPTGDLVLEPMFYAPRTRGGDPSAAASITLPDGCSPHTRG